MTRMIAAERPWTPDEDDRLRADYLRIGAAPLARALGRTIGAVYHEANRLGLIRYRPWTDADDTKLRRLWETTATLRSIARAVGRTTATTYWRAQKIGLPLGVPDGYVYVYQAAVKAGYAVATLWRILAWAGVAIFPARSRPSKRRGVVVGRRRHFHYVDPFDVEEAVERWCRTESVHQAARTRGLSGETLKRWLVAAGHRPPRKWKAHWRIESQEIDRVVTGRGVSLRAAAARIGVTRYRLRTALLRAKVKRPAGKLWRVALDEARRVLAA